MESLPTGKFSVLLKPSSHEDLPKATNTHSGADGDGGKASGLRERLDPLIKSSNVLYSRYQTSFLSKD